MQPEAQQEIYQAIARALARKRGFGIFFIERSPAQQPKALAFLQAHGCTAHIAIAPGHHRLLDRIAELPADTRTVLVTGLDECCAQKGDRRSPVFDHLSQQRENFRSRYPETRFVFLASSTTIDALIRYAPDFFDWRSGLFRLTSTI